jgi:hypothetical protein
VVAAVIATACLLASTGLGTPAVRPASAAVPQGRTIYINSAAYAPGGSCVMGSDSYTAGGTNECTLRAALTLANSQTDTATNPLRVTLATGFAAGDAKAIWIVEPTNMMITSSVNNLGSSGAHYSIAVPMEVDLQNKLYIGHRTNNKQTTFWVNAEHVNLFNFSHVQGGETVIGISGKSKWVNIQGGTTLTKTGVITKNFLLISNGADHISFSDYTVGNLDDGEDNNCDSAAVCFTPNGSTATTTNVSISNVTFTSSHEPGAAYTCTSEDSSGCVNNSIVFNANAKVDGLNVGESHFTNLKKGTSWDTVVLTGVIYSSVRLSNLDFHDNEILNSGSCILPGDGWCSLIYLPEGAPMEGKNYIRSNTFVNDLAVVSDQVHAISAYMNHTTSNNSELSNVYIENNHFDGFRGPAIWLRATGIATVSGNTFGPNTRSSEGDGAGEELVASGGDKAAMFMNNYTGANQKIVPWWPNSASIARSASGICELTLTMQSPSGADTTVPVLFDGYWTKSTKAEKYLGRTAAAVYAPKTGVAATFHVPDDMLEPDGRLAGGVRAQTQAMKYDQPQSSQYSRIKVASGTCPMTKIHAMVGDKGAIEGGTEIHLHGDHIQGDLDVTVGGVACDPLTVQSATTALCITPASARSPSKTGPVTVVVTAGSYTVATFTDGFQYVADGELRIDKRGWQVDPAAVEDMTAAEMYRKIMAGDVKAVEIESGDRVNPGIEVAWTYEASYVYLVEGEPYGGADDDGVTDVTIADDKLEEICSIPNMGLNTPVGCAAVGVVS